MTQTEFKQIKNSIHRHLKRELKHSQHKGYPTIKQVTAYSTEIVSLHQDNEEEETRHLLDKIAGLQQKPNTTLRVIGHTKPNGRYDIYTYTEFQFSTALVADEIPTYAVEDLMKQAVKRAIGIKSWEHLECKVMQLFKDGLIEWKDVVIAHKGECSL